MFSVALSVQTFIAKRRARCRRESREYAAKASPIYRLALSLSNASTVLAPVLSRLFNWGYFLFLEIIAGHICVSRARIYTYVK